ncbi:ribokinase [Paenibacillus guangzhouensis]|uniref:ribokinase n=1 Tax=Paenibacillus guangzhouensis TaxID=1473112 RepID=UPI001266E481|nr:ribokinase [Paenibacillus guangzhouensis]
MKKICILGSMNMDSSLLLEALPTEGETVFASGKLVGPGGKGFNQAVSAARLGATVQFIGKVGADDNGRQLVSTLQQEGIRTEHVLVDPNLPTGEALILFSNRGSNMIVVSAGSNMGITTQDVDQSREVIASSDVIVAQFEVPMDVIEHAFAIAKAEGKVTVLNPAPAKEIPSSLLQVTDFLIPNESEMHVITGCDTSRDDAMVQGAAALLKQGVGCVIVTLGERGSMICHPDGNQAIPAEKVQAIDTTAAGDSFIGSFCTKLEGQDYKQLANVSEAVRFASRFSSIVVQRKGAFQSIPYMHELSEMSG